MINYLFVKRDSRQKDNKMKKKSPKVFFSNCLGPNELLGKNDSGKNENPTNHLEG